MDRLHVERHAGSGEARQAPWWGVVLWGVSIGATLAVGWRAQAGEPTSAAAGGVGLDWMEVVVVGALLVVLLLLKWVDRDFGLPLGRFSLRRARGRGLPEGAFTLSAFRDSLDPAERFEGVFREDDQAAVEVIARSAGPRPRQEHEPVGAAAPPVGYIEGQEGVRPA